MMVFTVVFPSLEEYHGKYRSVKGHFCREVLPGVSILFFV
jgi:hypothetical protein